ncbi:MAG TPA: DUF2275 domain-containing protein [Geobacteraceae bacterium]
MEHEEIRRKLSAYLDNAVGGGEKEEIKRHLKSCGSCRGEIADLELTMEYLKTLPSAEPPPWLTAKIMATVRESAGPGRSLWQRLFLPLRVKLPLEAFALVFLCITGIYVARMINSQETLIVPPTPTHRSTSAASRQPAAPALPKAESAPRYIAPPAKSGAPRAMSVPPPPAVELPAPPKASLPEAAPAPVRPSEPAAVPELAPTDEGPSFERGAAPFYGKEEDGAPRVTHKGKRAVRGEPAAGGALGTSQSDKGEISLAVDDPNSAIGTIEEAVSRCGGSISGHSYGEDSHFLLVRIGTQKIPALVERLGRVGTVLSRPHLTKGGGGMADLTIRW